MKDVIVHIEEINKQKGFILLDFPSKDGRAGDSYNNFLELIQKDGDGKRTMLWIPKCTFRNRRKHKDNLYYKLPEELLQPNIWSINNNESEGRSYIAFTLNTEMELDFVTAGWFGDFEEQSKGELDENKVKEELGKEVGDWFLNLTVFNVGQGNCNVLVSKGHIIIYDLGSKSSTNIDNACPNIFAWVQRELCLYTHWSPKLILVISHWDIDHYSGLLNLDNRYLDRVDTFIVPEHLPNQTSRTAFDRIPNNKVHTVQARVGSDKSVLQEEIINSNFSLFKGTRSANRNKSGLSIVAKGKNFFAILPADHHYEQIQRYLVPPSESSIKIVIPHHGGKAGDSSMLATNNIDSSVISVGNNQWGHPVLANYYHLEGTVRWRTDIGGDYSTKL